MRRRAFNIGAASLACVAALLVTVARRPSRAVEPDSDDDSPALASDYEPCGDAIGVECGDGLECVTFDDPEAGICLRDCQSDADCGSGPGLCELTLDDGSQVCTLDCGSARCPFDTACEKWGDHEICTGG